jgi:5-(carboxyamino)imidazole ribonucleotide mutase
MVAILADSPAAETLLQHARDVLARFDVPYVQRTITDANIGDAVTELESAGATVFIATNTLAASIAPLTTKPVLAVPVESSDLPPLDALRNTTSSGAPVASLAIGKPGATNAALLAIAILANSNPALREKLIQFRTQQTQSVLADRLD